MTLIIEDKIYRKNVYLTMYDLMNTEKYEGNYDFLSKIKNIKIIHKITRKVKC